MAFAKSFSYKSWLDTLIGTSRNHLYTFGAMCTEVEVLATNWKNGRLVAIWSPGIRIFTQLLGIAVHIKCLFFKWGFVPQLKHLKQLIFGKCCFFKVFLQKQQEFFATTSMPNPKKVVWQKKEQMQKSPTTLAKLWPLLNQNYLSIEYILKQ